MISVIIPTLNEELALPAILDNLASQTLDQDQFEILVVDGNSTDQTQQLVKNHPLAKLITAKRGRARQMNRGAEFAIGDWLLFLHADTLLPDNGLQMIASLIKVESQAGCFHQNFSRNHWFLSFVSWLHNWRCKRTRIMYGDQAMFIRRKLFRKIGGFPENPILEDVMISELIVKETKPVILPQKVITSSRKFEQRGLYKSFFDIFIIMSCYELKLPILRQAFFARYR